MPLVTNRIKPWCCARPAGSALLPLPYQHTVTNSSWQVSTLIGYGSPNKADTHDVHGAPLGAEETAATRKNLKWEFGEFEVPKDVYDVFRSAISRGANEEAEWKKGCEEYAKK